MEINAGSSLTPETQSTAVNTEIPVTQANTAIPSTQAPSVPASGQPPANATPQEITDWTKDDRHERMWRKDPNQLYKSYRNMEKVYDPMKDEIKGLKGQIEQVDGLLKEYGYELNSEQLKSVLDELRSYTTDDEKLQKPVVRIGKYFEQQPWFNEPGYVDKLDKFTQNLYWEYMQEKYPGMTMPQIQKMNELEAKNKEIETRLTQKEQAERIKSTEMGIDKALKEIKAFSTENGFAFTDKIEQELIDFGEKTGTPPEYLYGEFMKRYGKEIQKSYSERVKQEQLQMLEKNKNNITLPAGTQGEATGEMTPYDTLKAGLRKAFGSKT